MSSSHKIIVLLFVLVSTTFKLNAQNQKYKAAYIYQFGRVIDWPGNYQSFTIGVWNEESLLPILNSIADLKKIKNKPIVVKKVESVNDISTCQIIYISSKSNQEMVQLKTAVKDKKVLIVSEGSTQRKAGAGISFVLVNGKLLFDIDKSNISYGGLDSPESLESLAHNVF